MASNRRGGARSLDGFEVRGAEDFLDLSKALKAAGQTELRKELNKAIRAAAKPLIPMTRAAARRDLPARGGFAAGVARAPQRVQVRTGQKSAGIRVVVGKNSSGARGANAGTIRHPVPGSGVWVDQSVTPGWFDETLKREAPSTARPAIEAALRDILNKVVREVR